MQGQLDEILNMSHKTQQIAYVWAWGFKNKQCELKKGSKKEYTCAQVCKFDSVRSHQGMRMKHRSEPGKMYIMKFAVYWSGASVKSLA